MNWGRRDLKHSDNIELRMWAVIKHGLEFQFAVHWEVIPKATVHPGGPTEEMMLRDFKVRIEEARQFLAYFYVWNSGPWNSKRPGGSVKTLRSPAMRTAQP